MEIAGKIFTGLRPQKKDSLTVRVEKAIEGDRVSMEKLVDSFHGDIARFVFFRIPTPQDAEDITQEVFVRMVRKLPGLKDKSRFKAWLFRIAVNSVKDYYRKRVILDFFGSSQELEASPGQPGKKENFPLDHVMDKEFVRQLRKMTLELSRWEREVFLLRFVNELTIKEIAHTLKKSQSTVKTHLYRALKKFRGNREFYGFLKERANEKG